MASKDHASPRGGSTSSWGHVLGTAALWLAVTVASLWAFLALWYFDPWPAWLRVPLALAGVAAAVAAIVRLPQARARRRIALGVLAVWLLWFCRTPSDRLDWTPDQARTPVATFDGNSVSVENFRFAAYRSEDDYDVAWQERTFDLDKLETVDFAVEPFASWRGPAHTLLSFGFSDGRHVAISVEIRKERGESFSPLGGLFRQFELMYVVGDERDLIGLRVNVRKSPVYLFPIRASRQQVRELFVSMLQRANDLHRRPEFYNTLTSTCTTNIVRHLEEVARTDVPFDLRVVLPGYSDELAFEMGLIDFDGSIADARQRFLIAGPVPVGPDGPAWSRAVRRQRMVPRNRDHE